MMKTISILIVDDSEADRYILKRFLGQLDLEMKIHEIANGQEAYEFLHDIAQNAESSQKISNQLVIFLDINMPLLSGIEFLKVYSKLIEPKFQHAGIIIYSSSKDEKDFDAIKPHKCVKAILNKGHIDEEKLLEAIQEAID